MYTKLFYHDKKNRFINIWKTTDNYVKICTKLFYQFIHKNKISTRPRQTHLLLETDLIFGKLQAIMLKSKITQEKYSNSTKFSVRNKYFNNRCIKYIVSTKLKK